MNGEERFGIMIDCSRNAVMSIPGFERFIDRCANMKYNTLMLYTEET